MSNELPRVLRINLTRRNQRLEQSEIERLLRVAEYKDALSGIETRPPSTWRDTAELRCLRALGLDRQCLQLAMRLYRSALVNDDPRLDDPKICEQLRVVALVFANQGEVSKACNIFKYLCKKNPNQADLRREYAFTLGLHGQLDSAELKLKNTLKIEVDRANTYELLAHIYCLTGRIRRGINQHYKAATLAPDNPNLLQKIAYWSNYCQYSNQQDQYQLAKLWANLAYPKTTHQNPSIEKSSANRRLKIGFVLADFNSRSLSRYVLPLLKNLDRLKFQVTAYSDAIKPNLEISAARKECDAWHYSSQLNDAQLAAQVRSDQIDVLVDLSGHCADNRLGVFAASPAAVQISWLGYPSTTGLSSIGYRISDRVCDPEGLSDAFFSEKLLRLSRGYLCYLPSPDAPDIRERNDSETIVLGSFSGLAKISDLSVDAWAAAMHAVPNSKLYLKREHFRNQSAIDQISSLFTKRGIDTARLQLSSEYVDHRQHLDQYNEIDIALDTTPYNGVTTTLDALWMGVPVVSLSSDTHASRRSASVLHRVGLKSLGVNNIAEFASQVKQLADDFQIRKQLRLTLRSAIEESGLCKHKEFAREFGDVLQSQWQQLQEARFENTIVIDEPAKGGLSQERLVTETSTGKAYPQTSETQLKNSD